ncbi:preprotein translocase subunit SecE [Desulfurobacterium indicum]|uniref:Protein translocase subunit SecE n=1 Tax=Desulfurobacterium indicum TaxID=1914305 RepID=A0A1R1MLF6_9BACT|nr:preprotein translocase subunit SecE [Desulfurobacterium indicum]OMH40589.1 preprotein translocase subunit SecE [Desulfurobacterium indicum]
MSPITFLKEVKQELDKVTWPTKEEVVEATIGVLVFTGIIAAYFWVIDMIFTKLLQFIIKQGV